MIFTISNLPITTERLSVSPVELNDCEFLMELMNSPDWLKFIGDRNVPTLSATQIYIGNITNNPNINYLIVRDKETLYALGIVTLIKREYLEHWDIGFAFLPRFNGNGFAYEASKALLNNLMAKKEYQTLLATTKKDNTSSIKLLLKLGFHFTQEIRWQDEVLQLYTYSEIKK